jgi:hypothetical protein
LNERRKIAGKSPIELDNIAHKVKAVNDYVIIVQEYFQARIIDFLQHYAKEGSSFNTILPGFNLPKGVARFMYTFYQY